MKNSSLETLVLELSQLKEVDPVLVGDKIKEAHPEIQTTLANRLGYAIGKTRAGRSFRRINPRNTVVAGSAGIIFNEDQTSILMQERWGTDGMWEPCGGGLRFGESLQQNVIREALEETGYLTTITGFIGIFASPKSDEILTYPDQEHRHCVVSIFALKALAQAKDPDEEVTDLRWTGIDQILHLPMLPVHRRIMEIALSPRGDWPIVA